jgi:hypothetical protein
MRRADFRLAARRSKLQMRFDLDQPDGGVRTKLDVGDRDRCVPEAVSWNRTRSDCPRLSVPDKLAITVFDGYDDIVDKACTAWNFFAGESTSRHIYHHTIMGSGQSVRPLVLEGEPGILHKQPICSNLGEDSSSQTRRHSLSTIMGSFHIWLARRLYSFRARQILMTNGRQQA